MLRPSAVVGVLIFLRSDPARRSMVTLSGSVLLDFFLCLTGCDFLGLRLLLALRALADDDEPVARRELVLRFDFADFFVLDFFATVFPRHYDLIEKRQDAQIGRGPNPAKRA